MCAEFYAAREAGTRTFAAGALLRLLDRGDPVEGHVAQGLLRPVGPADLHGLDGLRRAEPEVERVRGLGEVPARRLDLPHEGPPPRGQPDEGADRVAVPSLA